MIIIYFDIKLFEKIICNMCKNLFLIETFYEIIDIILILDEYWFHYCTILICQMFAVSKII